MNAFDLLSKLEKVKKTGEGRWMARCPAHKDGTASLAISESGDKILLKCHAGCETKDVLESLKLTFADLGSPKSNGYSDSKPKIVATYDYADELGGFLFQAVRLEPKDFRQRHKDANGEWVWNLRDVQIVPYHLDKCVKAVAGGETLHVVEGEKDCDVMWKNGLCSTCNPMGAGKWRDDFSGLFKGVRRVRVWADKDKTGRDHAVAVAKSMASVCEDVRVGLFPDINGHKIKDAADWFGHGGSVSEFLSLESSLPVFDLENPFPESLVSSEVWSIRRLIGFAPEADPNALVGLNDGKTTRYLCKGYGGWLIGSSGLGKSSLAIQQAVMWCLGRPFFGATPVRPLRILFIQSENDEGDMAEPVQGILDSIPITPAEVDRINEALKIVRCRGATGAKFCDWMQAEVLKHHADVVYADPLLRFAGIDVSRQDQCTRFLNDSLDPVLAKTGVVLMGIHHTGKPKQEKQKPMTIYDFMYSGLGSSELVNWARVVSVILPIADGIFELKLAKRGKRAWATHPNGEKTTSLYLKHHETRIFWEQIDPPNITESTNNRNGGRPSMVDQIATMNLYSFCVACKPEGEGLNEISKRLAQWLAHEKIDASLPTCKRAIAALVANEKLGKTDTLLYIKGAQA